MRRVTRERVLRVGFEDCADGRQAPVICSVFLFLQS
jgi:hypothetical protein